MFPPRPYVGYSGKYCKEFPKKNVESKLQPKQPKKFAKKISEKKISKQNGVSGNYSQYYPKRKLLPTLCRIKGQILQRMSEILKASCKQNNARQKFRKKNFTKKMILTGIIHSITVTSNTFVHVSIAKQCLLNPAKNSFQTCSVTAKKVRNR